MAYTKLSIKISGFTGNVTSGSAVITNISVVDSIGSLKANQLIKGAGIPQGARILTVDSATQITLDANATADGTGVSLVSLSDEVVSSRSQGLYEAVTINGINFDGTSNISVPGSTTSATAPSNPVDGDLWWDSTDGNLYVYYDDGSSAQWVEAVFGTGGGGSTPGGSDGNIQYNNAGAFGGATNLNWNDTTSVLDATGTIVADRFDLDTAATMAAEQAGRIHWNDPDGTANLGLKAGFHMHIGQQVMFYGKASTAISKGQAVQFAGAEGDHILMKPAVPSEINANPDYFIGFAPLAISQGEFGYIMWFGYVNGLDTTSLGTAGTILWFASASGSNGQLTSTKPSAPNAKIQVAAVVRASTGGAENGRVLVRIDLGSKLGGTDSNVEFTSLSAGEMIGYNSANSRWENTPDLVWDFANSRLGVGTTSPDSTLHVVGDLKLVGDLNVQGDINYINTETLLVSDNTILLNSDYAGTTGEDAFIEVERGTSLDNVSIKWNESTDRWQFTNDGTNFLNLPYAGEVIGYTGSKGDTGYTGSAGTQGPIGYTGSVGAQGSIGYTGSQGAQGPIGYTGSVGAQGPIGYTGSKGDIGYTGSLGATGYTGSKGDQGIQGPQGNFGGATFEYVFSTDLNNTDPGTGKLKFSETPFDGALTMYIDDQDQNATDIQTFLRTIDDSTSTIKGHFRVSNQLNADDFALFTISSISELTGYFSVSCSYVSGSATSFSNNEELIITFARTGDKGDTGYTGSQGAVGYTGSIGYTGSVGAQGPIGYTGSQGVQGPIGYTGSVGAQGPIGYTGSVGAQGPIGYTGSKGDIGYTGSVGAQGPIGYTGSVGAQGSIGYTGSKGDTGYTGSVGVASVANNSLTTGDAVTDVTLNGDELVLTRDSFLHLGSSGSNIAQTAYGDKTFANNVVVSGTLTVNGLTTTINSTTISVDDKNIELGSVASPTDVTADGGGITLKGATDKTLNWVNATDSWTSSENIEIAANKSFRYSDKARMEYNSTSKSIDFIFTD